MEPNLIPYFKKTFLEAKNGSQKGDGGPFGAIVLLKRKIISLAHNTVLKDNDPTCHAEVNAIRKACKKLKNFHLKGAILIASSEPCPMCLTTAYWAQIDKIYYALPRSVAADYNFIDDFIYIDLKKPLKKRKLQVIKQKGLLAEGTKIFQNWQKKHGKIY